jgi:hypothetical protein
MVLVPVLVLGSRMVAVRVLSPVVPVKTRSLKSAAPATADRVVVPESVAPLAVRAIDWLAAVPVVIRFASASWISTRIAEPKVRALLDVVAPVTTTLLTAP